MKFLTAGHRHGDYLFSSLPEYRPLWHEIQNALAGIGDADIVSAFNAEKGSRKSISHCLNVLIKERLVSLGWTAESSIFADGEYSADSNGIWRVDFAKTLEGFEDGGLSVEVAFNHRSDIAWNLVKPTLASELNHVEKALQTGGGVIICATEAMKVAGGFDPACGSFELYVKYLMPLRSILSAPMAIVGLQPPESFHVEHTVLVNPKTGRRQRIGRIVKD